MEHTRSTYPIGESVCVHLNLSKGCFVIADRPKGQIYGYADSVCLADVTFKVSEAQRQYCIAKGGRWVHAFALGTLVSVGSPVPAEASVEISYNPFRSADFHVKESGVPVHKVATLHFAARHCYAAVEDIL